MDIATLENNHIGNYGPEGIDATKDLLTSEGIAWADAFTPAVLEVRGLRFAFVAFNGVGGSFDRELIARQIAAAREQADVVVAAFHWGAEYVAIPQAAPGIANDDPVEIAHLAVDAGADLVLGNHPHWVQGLEVYKDKLIAYAHGNFILDQMWSRETTIGVVGPLHVLRHEAGRRRVLAGDHRGLRPAAAAGGSGGPGRPGRHAPGQHQPTRPAGLEALTLVGRRGSTRPR